MTQMICYKLKSGKYVWTNDLAVLKDTIWEAKIVGGLNEAQKQ